MDDKDYQYHERNIIGGMEIALLLLADVPKSQRGRLTSTIVSRTVTLRGAEAPFGRYVLFLFYTDAEWHLLGSINMPKNQESDFYESGVMHEMAAKLKLLKKEVSKCICTSDTCASCPYGQRPKS